jgi:hypothetical protein
MTTTTPQMKPLKSLTDAQRMALEEGRRIGPAASADAQYVAGTIVKHMWIIFVLMPLIACLLYRLFFV